MVVTAEPQPPQPPPPVPPETLVKSLRRRVLVTAIAGAVVNVLCITALTPLFPDVARDLHLGPDGLGFIVGISSLMSVLFQLPVGIAVDRFGAKPSIALGLFFVSVAQLIRWIAPDATSFAIGQVALGLSVPLCNSACLAAVANAYAGEGRAEALGLVLSGTNLGQIMGFVVVGILGQSIGWRSISLGLAAVPLLLTPLVATMPETARERERTSPERTPATLGRRLNDALRFLVDPMAARLATIGLLALGAGSAATYLLPFLLRQQSIGSAVTGLLLLPFVGGALLGGPALGRLADRSGALLPIRLALLVATAAIAVFAAAGPRPATVAGCFLILGFCVGGVLSLVPSQIVDLAESKGWIGTGAALGGLRVAQMLGPTLGPAFAGGVFVWLGPVAALLAASAALFAALLCSAGFRLSRPNPAV